MDGVLALLGQPPDVVAPQLLGGILQCCAEHGAVALRITEVEAYAGVGQDAASHAHRGQTPRNFPMFAEPGTVYVYRSYGIHLCLNLVTGRVGDAGAVLIRAGEVTTGIDIARRRRGLIADKPDEHLARGPGNVGRALGISLEHSGSRLDTAGPLSLTLARGSPPRVSSGPRVGVSREAHRHWRWWVEADPTVSAYRLAAGLRAN